jgi:hypothetical protein
MIIPHADAIRQSLKKSIPHLPTAHAAIVSGLVADGLVRDGDGGEIHARDAGKARRVLTVLQASADKANLPILKQLCATALRYGYEMPFDKPLSLTEIDRAFRANGADVEARIAWKQTAHRLGLLK